uniref:Uncharacterized protein n=1 Tax=Lepeophtheirus salmonis TaxID=72036 RepID=A0A0K2T1C2_LEPSM
MKKLSYPFLYKVYKINWCKKVSTSFLKTSRIFLGSQFLNVQPYQGNS